MKTKLNIIKSFFERKIITIIKVVQATHHQGDVRYCTSRGNQCLCISLVSVSWTLFRSPGLWDKFDLDCILCKGNQFYISLTNLIVLG